MKHNSHSRSFVLLVCILLSSCFSQNPSPKSPTLEDYESAVNKFEDLDSELYRKYGIYPEEALSIVSCYAEFEDHEGLTFDDFDNAWMLLREYYYQSRNIVLSLD